MNQPSLPPDYLEIRGLTVTFGKRTGSYSPWWRAVDLVVHDRRGRSAVEIDRRSIPSTYDAGSRTVRVTIKDPIAGGSVSFATDRAR